MSPEAAVRMPTTMIAGGFVDGVGGDADEEAAGGVAEVAPESVDAYG